jgi:hypothetical protein
MAELNIPVAFCTPCSSKMPVFIKEFNLGFDEEFTELDGEAIECVICAQCSAFLNLENGIEIEYYSSEDLFKVTNYRVVDDGRKEKG